MSTLSAIWSHLERWLFYLPKEVSACRCRRKSEKTKKERENDAHVLETRGGAKTLMSPPKVILRPGIASNKPIYGPPMAEQYLMMAPVNEQGVLFLFGAVARKLGFAVLRVQTGYPDCEAMREVAPGQWQWVRIELEHESRNFLLHGHAPEFCDLIVCWKHNWEDCPLEVIELSSIVKELAVEEICCARCRERESLTATVTDKHKAGKAQ